MEIPAVVVLFAEKLCGNHAGGVMATRSNVIRGSLPSSQSLMLSSVYGGTPALPPGSERPAYSGFR